MISTIKPAVVVDGNGLDQHTNTVQTVRTTSILRSLIRSVQEKGGSVMLPFLPFVDVQRRGSQPSDFYNKSVCKYPLYAAGGFGLTGVEMLDSLLTQKPFGIRALIVQGGDPAAVLSGSAKVQEALSNLDLLVVHDLFPTATGRLADFLLPAASFLERDLVLNYRYRPRANVNLIAMQNQCVPPSARAGPTWSSSSIWRVGSAWGTIFRGRRSRMPSTGNWGRTGSASHGFGNTRADTCARIRTRNFTGIMRKTGSPRLLERSSSCPPGWLKRDMTLPLRRTAVSPFPGSTGTRLPLICSTD